MRATLRQPGLTSRRPDPSGPGEPRWRHPDPYRDIDTQADPLRFVEALETRGRTPTHRRLRRRFLRLAAVEPGHVVLEVGCGTGVVLRDLLSMVGSGGRVVGIDPSRLALRAARMLARAHSLRSRLALRVGDGARLPFRSGRFDRALAITVMLHVEQPLVIVKEMSRVVRRGGLVGLQDQDFGTVAVEHPESALTARILNEVATRLYPDPCSGRRLPRLLRDAGLDDVRVVTDVYQDTTLEPYTKGFLERRAENAVRFQVVDASTAQHWLDGFTDLVARGAFLFTTNYYGATGRKP